MDRTIKKKWRLPILLFVAGLMLEPGNRADANQPGFCKPSPTILIVDDTPTNVELMESILKTEGFGTLVATDGPAAFYLL